MHLREVWQQSIEPSCDAELTREVIFVISFQLYNSSCPEGGIISHIGRATVVTLEPVDALFDLAFSARERVLAHN